MSSIQAHVVNVDDIPEREHLKGDHWGGAYKPLTPVMDATAGRLGVSLSRLPPGRTTCPFHYHQLEDEVFFILSGRGVLRYGDEVRAIRAGDCVSCPAGTRVAHQIVNTWDQDLVYLAIGRNDPNEVCVYPDSGKVMVRSLNRVGFFEKVDYYEGEPTIPKILSLAQGVRDPVDSQR